MFGSRARIDLEGVRAVRDVRWCIETHAAMRDIGGGRDVTAGERQVDGVRVDRDAEGCGNLRSRCRHRRAGKWLGPHDCGGIIEWRAGRNHRCTAHDSRHAHLRRRDRDGIGRLDERDGSTERLRNEAQRDERSISDEKRRTIEAFRHPVYRRRR